MKKILENTDLEERKDNKMYFLLSNENKTSQQEFQKKIPSVQYSPQLQNVTDDRDRPHGNN